MFDKCLPAKILYASGAGFHFDQINKTVQKKQKQVLVQNKFKKLDRDELVAVL